MDVVKKNLKAIVAVFLGLFHFILLTIPFLGISAEGMGEAESLTLSGYTCFGETVKAMEAGGFMIFAQIVFLIAAIAVLLIGLYLLLVSFLGSKINLPDSFGPVSADKLCTWIHIGYAATSVLAFLATMIVSIANSKSTEFLYYTATVKVSVGFGVVLGLLLAVGSFVAVLLVEKNGGMEAVGDAAAKTRFVCAQCGETAKKGSAFCSKCGGQVVELAPTKPMCTVCGAPAKKGDVFCSKCGGRVEEVALTKPVCESCGAPAKNGAAFCSQCGGKIVQK